LLAIVLFPSNGSPQADRRFGFLGALDGQLLSPGGRVSVASIPRLERLELWFVPEVGDEVLVGSDTAPVERTFGPDCGDEPCQTGSEYSFLLPPSLRAVPEGWGHLEARDPATGEAVRTGRLYWDETPPRARFLEPRFNLPPTRRNGWRIVAFTEDENVVFINVKWFLASETARFIPLFEQHKLGAQFANNGHAACVPTTIAALLRWLENTGQWKTTLPFFTDQFMVNSLGFFMGTTNSGTSGSGGVQGIVDFLEFWFGYQRNVHYTLEHPLQGASPGQVGFTPQRLYAECQKGGAIAVGLHNMPPSDDPGVLFNDPPFGHAMALDDIVLNADGSAWVRLMDPNVEPPGSNTGKYRWFKMNPDGSLNWSDANVEYYNPFPFTGKVRLDEMYILRDFVFIAGLAQGAEPLASVGGDGNHRRRREVPTEGEVPGGRFAGGRLWIGHFRPPKGSPGPWLLVTESTDRAGFMQRDLQIVGAELSDLPEPPPR
jgi:hypothetical protein